jgi:hypothetical protein
VSRLWSWARNALVVWAVLELVSGAHGRPTPSEAQPAGVAGTWRTGSALVQAQAEQVAVQRYREAGRSGSPSCIAAHPGPRAVRVRCRGVVYYVARKALT